MTEQEHKCETCRRGYIPEGCTEMVCEIGPDMYEDCPPEHTCEEWEGWR